MPGTSEAVDDGTERERRTRFEDLILTARTIGQQTNEPA
jgi:hypothetical protein